MRKRSRKWVTSSIILLLALFFLNRDHVPMSLFHRTATFFLIIFMGVMAIATGIAFTRKSGNTGMDMGKVHLLRMKK